VSLGRPLDEAGHASLPRHLAAALTAALAILLLPILAVAVPPLVDYPNHLVRMWLIAGGAQEPPLDGIYGVD